MIKCILLKTDMLFKEFFFETYDLDLFMEGTTAVDLKAHKDQELVKMIKAKVQEQLVKTPFFETPIGKKMFIRYINFFTYQMLQDKTWYGTLQRGLTDTQWEENPRFALSPTEIKQNSVMRIGNQIAHNWRGWGDYFVAMGDRLAGKLNDPTYTTLQVNREVANWHVELAEKRKGLPDQEAKTFLKLDHLGPKWNGWNWVDLEKGYCPLEAKAMGHCGNEGGAEEDNIVSLRDPKGRAHLTFVINDGFIGQAKGKGNDKPSQKYHAPIVELLKSNYVQSIRGGGYAPENNFKFDDLHDDHKKELEHKPHMSDPVGYVAEKYKDDPKKMVGAMNEFFGTVFEDFDGNNFVVETFKEHERRSTRKDGSFMMKWIGPYTTIEEASERWGNGPLRVGWLDEHDGGGEGYHGLDTSELVNKLNTENLDKIKEIISASRNDLDGGIDEYDLEELVDEDDEITNALSLAAGDTQDSANQGEAYNSVHKQLEEEDENGFWIDFKNDPWQLKISLNNVKALHKEMENQHMLEEESLDSYIVLQYAEPQGGFYGNFDDSHYNELVSDSLTINF